MQSVDRAERTASAMIAVSREGKVVIRSDEGVPAPARITAMGFFGESALVIGNSVIGDRNVPVKQDRQP